MAVAQEFHISVTPLGEDEYWVRTERVAPGVPLAEEQVKWPVEDWLSQARQLMNDPLMELLHGDSTPPDNPDAPVIQSTLNLVALGQQLYNALFQGSLRDSWIIAQAMASKQGSVLRLRLGLKGTRLPRLPWEALHAADRPLATGTDVAFSRYQLISGLRTQISTPVAGQNQPLKILMVISAPTDQENLALKEEASHLQAELRSRFRSGSPAIQLTLLEQPGREQLTQALEQGQYQVFHYAGHSNLGASGGDLYLVSRKTGLTEMLSGDDLAGLLVNNGVQMAVFNSCRGAYTAASDPADSPAERNLSEALVKRGISSVLAMAERIPDEVALTLAQLFYRNLNQGYPIDLSLNRARQGLLSAYGSRQLYWALPILYLHPEFDGYLTAAHQVMNDAAELLVFPDASEIPLTAEDKAAFTTSQLPTLKFSAEDEVEVFPLEQDFYDDYEEGEWEPSPFDDLGDLDASGDYEDDYDVVSHLLSQLSQESKPAEAVTTAPPPQTLPFRSNEPKSEVETATKPQMEPIKTPKGGGLKIASQPQKTVSFLGSLGFKLPFYFGKWDSSKGVKQNFRRFPWWLLLGATVAVVILGFWFFQNRNPQPGNLLSADNQSSPLTPPLPDPNQQNLKASPTSAVTALAIEQFTQGDFGAGQRSVEALLDREALPQVKAALEAVPNQQRDDPGISFLQGRLAWQFVKKGNKDYSVDDARRSWEIAVKKQPKNPLYLSALGFAYYAEGNFDRANQVLFDALYLTGEKQSLTQKDALNIQAALALGLQQAAQKQSADKRAKLLDESKKLRQKVITDDPVNFQPDALSKDWIWPEKAIQDWRQAIKN